MSSIEVESETESSGQLIFMFILNGKQDEI